MFIAAFWRRRRQRKDFQKHFGLKEAADGLEQLRKTPHELPPRWCLDFLARA
jgi:hypothetical protein